jgi:acetylornithine deacetylase/succinyl-diaminopimelate desuccinylase-like protein
MDCRMDGQEAHSFVKENHDRFLAELGKFLAIPSVSTLPQHREDIARAASWLSEQLKEIGFGNVKVNKTDRHPIVTAEWLDAPNKPTILAYGHYDVQPVDPVNEWASPPFSPTVRLDNIYARGASDMKGQVHALLKALEFHVKRTGGLPVNVKILFEGEEEIGSPSIESFLKRNKSTLRSDLCLNGDSGILGEDKPSLTYGLRGLAYFEVEVRGPKTDLHSGSFGGVVENPAHALSELIAGMHDAKGHITLPGFYDEVRRLSKKEREELRRYPLSDAKLRRAAGVRALHGERGFTPIELMGARPSLDVNGISSGFEGEGQKTIIPSRASAKISMRLVPNQTPDQVEASLRGYIESHSPDTVVWQLKRTAGAAPAIINRESPGFRAAMEALQSVYGKRPVVGLDGGTVPIVSLLKEELGIDTVMLGFNLPDDSIHGPNEKLHLPSYFRGIETYATFLDILGNQS